MRKLFSLIAATLFLSVATYGQIQNEKGNLPLNKRTIPLLSSRSINTNLTADFESSNELPLAWTTSVSNPWFVDDDGSGTNNIVIFNMWDYANNAEGYLYTPEMQITSVDSILTCEIEYYLVGGNYGSAGKLYVDVSTNGGSTWTSSTTNLLTGHAGTGVFTFSLNFSNYMSNNYIGQNVKVRFKGVSDYGSYNIAIDNVQGPALVPHTDDISVNSINTPDAVLVGPNVDITGTIRNLSNQEALTSFDLTYSIDGGAQVATYNISGLNVASGAYYNFTHNIPWTSLIGIHSINIEVSNPNGNTDVVPSDNTLNKDILVVYEQYPKTVVYEEGTGTWCGWCVRGLVGLNTMAHNYTDGSWIGIAVHNGDPMVLTAYDAAMGGYISGYPSGIMDRHTATVDPGLSTLNAAFQEHLTIVPAAKVEITNQSWNASSRAITVTSTATFAADITSGNYRMSAIVIEDGVTGTTNYEQDNYYSGGTYGAMTDWDGTNYANLANPVPAASMVYNHVGRALLGGFQGQSGSIPTSIAYNTPYNYTFNYTLPAAYDANEIKLVALILKYATGEIVNATEVDLDVNTGIAQVNGNVKLYPNPTTGVIKVVGVEGAQILVYNLVGEIVAQIDHASAQQSIELGHLANGNYMVKVIQNDQVSTQKVVLTK